MNQQEAYNELLHAAEAASKDTLVKNYNPSIFQYSQ